MDQESGFIVEPQLDGSLAGLELVHRSETGFAEIWRATKFSQFVVLKALKAVSDDGEPSGGVQGIRTGSEINSRPLEDGGEPIHDNIQIEI